MNFKITDMKLEGHSIRVPEGLAEILNKGNGWGKRKAILNPEYDRKVVKEEGELTTILTKK